jgi:four helix bundle protein
MTTPPTDFQTRSFAFACLIVNLYRSLDKARTVPSYLARQVLRSGTSIGANLEEAKAAQSRRDLISKFSISLKESRETRYWLRLIQRTCDVSGTSLDSALVEANELVSVLTTSLRRLRHE